VLEAGHGYGNVEKSMSIIRKARKGKFMSSLQKYHIFLANKQEIHMNDFTIDNNNPIFDTLYRKLEKIPA
jgi:hypothetical protein